MPAQEGAMSRAVSFTFFDNPKERGLYQDYLEGRRCAVVATLPKEEQKAFSADLDTVMARLERENDGAEAASVIQLERWHDVLKIFGAARLRASMGLERRLIVLHHILLGRLKINAIRAAA
jgi:hypothetical protein